MIDFERAAIVGTGQVAASSAELTHTPVDALVAGLEGVERERALLLRAGALGLLERGARAPLIGAARPEPAAAERLRGPSARLAELLATLLTGGEEQLLHEALERMAAAGIHLPAELLPSALGKGAEAIRIRLRPVLGERGRWLARSRTEWAWARSEAPSGAALPADLDARWQEGSAAERRVLLQAARRIEPERARQLAAESWKQEKAEQRLAWLGSFETNLTLADEPFLLGALGDRSAQVRLAAARLLWLLPESGLASSLRGRVEGLLAVAAPSAGVLDKLRGVLGGGSQLNLRVELPAETFDAAWEREGVVESAPHGVGRRQWWLSQMLSAVHPDHWWRSLGHSATALVAAAAAHDLAGVLLDGLAAAALRHAAVSWFAPLYDALVISNPVTYLTNDPIAALAAQLPAADAQPRMLAILDGGRLDLLHAFAQPWPRAVAQRFVRGLDRYRAGWTAALTTAALAIPVDLLPTGVLVPDVPEDDPHARHYLRAFEQFQSIAAARRALAQEMTP